MHTFYFSHTLHRPIDAPDGITLCLCGNNIRRWSFLDPARSIQAEISPELRSILNSIALGIDPRNTSIQPVPLARPKSMVMSGKFSMLRPQSVVYSGSSSAAAGGGVKINPFARQVNTLPFLLLRTVVSIVLHFYCFCNHSFLFSLFWYEIREAIGCYLRFLISSLTPPLLCLPSCTHHHN